MARVTAAERRRELGQQFRVDSVRMSAAAGSGHPTSAMSAADLIAVLVDGYLRYDFAEPKSPANDRLVFSKGHASTLLYAIYRAAGVDPTRSSSTTASSGACSRATRPRAFRGSTSRPARSGRACRSASAWRSRRNTLDRLPYRVWVLCGDSEMAEGSMWEAFEHAAHYELDNLTAIIDVNRLGQRGETMVGWNLDAYARRAEAFGWNAIEVDGHDVEAIDDAFTSSARRRRRPTVVIARTLKGKGVAAVENQNGWHGKPLDDPDGGDRRARRAARSPRRGREARRRRRRSRREVTARASSLRARNGGRDTKGVRGRTRSAGSRAADVVALDGEVSNSTFAEIFAKAHPERYFEMYIAEQQLVAAAVGLQALGWRPFASTFAAFFSRAYDFVRMAAISRATFSLCRLARRRLDRRGRAVADGARGHRVAPGDPRLHRPPSVRREPDGQLVAAMADTDGISYLRTLRPATPVLYRARRGVRDRWQPLLRSSDEDEVTIVAAGITVHEALKAAERLAERGNRRARDRPVLGQAARRRDAPARCRGDQRRGS